MNQNHWLKQKQSALLYWTDVSFSDYKSAIAAHKLAKMAQISILSSAVLEFLSQRDVRAVSLLQQWREWRLHRAQVCRSRCSRRHSRFDSHITGINICCSHIGHIHSLLSNWEVIVNHVAVIHLRVRAQTNGKWLLDACKWDGCVWQMWQETVGVVR